MVNSFGEHRDYQNLMNITTKEKIIKGIEMYLSEPTGYIRAIPDPENLLSFIEDAVDSSKADVMAESLSEEV